METDKAATLTTTTVTTTTSVPWVDHPTDDPHRSNEDSHSSSDVDDVTETSEDSTDPDTTDDDEDIGDGGGGEQTKRRPSDGGDSEDEDGEDGDRTLTKQGSVILQTLQQKPKKKKHMDESEKEQYRKEKKEWLERKKELKQSLSPNEKKEYRREKKELSINEKNERKKQREERRRAMKEKRKLHSKPKLGKIVTPETKSYELVCDMLLGIRVTVSKVAAKPLKNAECVLGDYKVTNLKFPKGGSSNGTFPTPAHSQRDFAFRDYAPAVFRRIREHFGIESADYLMSLTRDYLLSELISPGQSGQFFYFSYDLRFMLKTLTAMEAHFLKKILPGYYDHILKNPDSLMARFFGFHRVAPHGDRKHYFIVMGNIFAQNVEIMYRFDLKGSFVNRVTPAEKIKNDPNVVMKDQDFDNMQRSLILGPEKAQIFQEQVKRDVKFLEDWEIMDYSLLIGIHDLKRAQKVDRRRSLSMVYIPKADEDFGAASTGFNDDSDSELGDQSDEYKQYHITAFTRDQGGFRSTDEDNNPCDEIYFLGIIDILQPYNMRKFAEHSFKKLRYDGTQISAVNPRFYARRFCDYMFAHVRVPEGTKGEPIGEDPDDDLLADKPASSSSGGEGAAAERADAEKLTRSSSDATPAAAAVAAATTSKMDGTESRSSASSIGSKSKKRKHTKAAQDSGGKESSADQVDVAKGGSSSRSSSRRNSAAAAKEPSSTIVSPRKQTETKKKKKKTKTKTKTKTKAVDSNNSFASADTSSDASHSSALSPRVDATSSDSSASTQAVAAGNAGLVPKQLKKHKQQKKKKTPAPSPQQPAHSAAGSPSPSSSLHHARAADAQPPAIDTTS
eukprot:TRINITY_DN3849_c1_g1_i4.p1 TRINITY_DN3849_c1_g1~~TRINITY_DN3849_c1_g1_i4.p1  ORF type:complete len:843 (+),score=226.72 TRINITY_DN3849_c1_g1_i4:265-2793(+)